MVSHPETDSDPPIKSDRESGCDSGSFYFVFFCIRYFDIVIRLGPLMSEKASKESQYGLTPLGL